MRICRLTTALILLSYPISVLAADAAPYSAEEIRDEVKRVGAKMGLDIGDTAGPAFGWMVRGATTQQSINRDAIATIVLSCMKSTQYSSARLAALHSCEDSQIGTQGSSG